MKVSVLSKEGAFEEYNECARAVENREQCRIVSMDIKALYPSMKWNDIIKAVREMIVSSEMSVENVNWHEVGKYLAVMMSKEDIEKEGLYHVVPKRKSNRKITINYLQNKQNNKNWYKSRKPGVVQQKRMLALAITIGVHQVLSSHTYKVGDEIYLQTEGGPIGLELTGAVCRPFMISWDKKYLRMVKDAGIMMVMYKRYIDDSNQLARVPPEGAVYDGNTKKIVINEEEGELAGLIQPHLQSGR